MEKMDGDERLDEMEEAQVAESRGRVKIAIGGMRSSRTATRDRPRQGLSRRLRQFEGVCDQEA